MVRDRATLQAIAAAAPNAGHVAGASAAILIVMDGVKPIPEGFDEGRVAERILIAATAHDLASALGWVTSAGRPAVMELLGVPAPHTVRALVSLGHPTAGRRPKARPGEARKPLDALVRWERWS